MQPKIRPPADAFAARSEGRRAWDAGYACQVGQASEHVGRGSRTDCRHVSRCSDRSRVQRPPIALRCVARALAACGGDGVAARAGIMACSKHKTPLSHALATENHVWVQIVACRVLFLTFCLGKSFGRGHKQPKLPDREGSAESPASDVPLFN